MNWFNRALMKMDLFLSIFFVLFVLAVLLFYSYRFELFAGDKQKHSWWCHLEPVPTTIHNVEHNDKVKQDRYNPEKMLQDAQNKGKGK